MQGISLSDSYWKTSTSLIFYYSYCPQVRSVFLQSEWIYEYLNECVHTVLTVVVCRACAWFQRANVTHLAQSVVPVTNPVASAHVKRVWPASLATDVHQATTKADLLFSPASVSRSLRPIIVLYYGRVYFEDRIALCYVVDCKKQQRTVLAMWHRCLCMESPVHKKCRSSINQSINQSINHEFLEWPKYLKHC